MKHASEHGLLLHTRGVRAILRFTGIGSVSAELDNRANTGNLPMRSDIANMTVRQRGPARAGYTGKTAGILQGRPMKRRVFAAAQSGFIAKVSSRLSPRGLGGAIPDLLRHDGGLGRELS